MKTFTLSTIFSLFISASLFGQSECNGSRYITEVFSTIKKTSAVEFGANIPLSGSSQKLYMDVYEPDSDLVQQRPTIVWMHGGSFITGTRDGGDVTLLSNPLTKMGFVNVSIDYRLGMDLFSPDSVDGTEAVMRAVHDARAAVRFLYKSARTGNPYGVDTNRIIIAGVSAGAIAAVHYGYLDEISEWPTWVDSTKAGLGGGVQGNSGNPGYPSDVIGVINIAGALARLNWMKSGDMPIVSLHGTVDDVVPYSTDIIYMLGLYPIMTINGSYAINQRANSVGVNSCFYPYVGQAHVPHVSSAMYVDTTVAYVKNYILGWVCPTSGSCSYNYVVGIDNPNIVATDVELFPNPVADQLNIRFKNEMHGTWKVSVYDLTGKLIREQNSQTGLSGTIDCRGMNSGIYLVKISTETGEITKKIVLN